MKVTNLKLLATSDKDLRVIAAHLQDSIVLPKDVANLKKNRIFLIQLNRFMWEDVERGVFRKNKRIRTVLKFDNVISVLSKNINMKDNKNFLDLSLFPIPLNKLVELINIQLIKLKFNYQSKINIKGYELNLNSKFFSKNNLSLKLTEKEIEIILYLNKTKIKHDVADLQKNIWSYKAGMETHTVETHIYRLRKKMSDLFKDEAFISSHENGYFIG